ncbi:MAG: hypothetical protein AB7O78_01530 [Thermoleophilia bacterium]
MAADDSRAVAVLHELRRRDAWVPFSAFGWDIREEGHRYSIPETAVRKRLSELVEVGLVEQKLMRPHYGGREVLHWRALPKEA